MRYEMKKNKNSSHHCHRDDVEEATLALKGMLGISLITPSPTTTTTTTTPSKKSPQQLQPKKNSYASTVTSAKQSQPQQSQPQSNTTKGKKKKNHNKNHRNNNKYHSTTTNSSNSNSTSNSNDKKKQYSNDKNDENFAWSAFQSPPDASTLPMPAFGASSSSIEVDQKEEDLPIAEESRSTAASNEDAIKALLNIDTPTKKQPTGVNLAAAANANRHLRPNEPLYHPAASPPPPQPPLPPYVTIQVQVPPILLPGRQMMVPPSNITGPYPIPVIVPEGVQPGMVIPVHVPAIYPPHMIHPTMYNTTTNTNTTNNPNPPLFPPTSPHNHNPNNPL